GDFGDARAGSRSTGQNIERDALSGDSAGKGRASESDVGGVGDLVGARELPHIRRAAMTEVVQGNRYGAGRGCFVNDHYGESIVGGTEGSERREVVRIRDSGGDAGTAEGGFGAVVVAIHLNGFEGRCAGGRSGPVGRNIEPFAAENAENVRLGGSAVDVV